MKRKKLRPIKNDLMQSLGKKPRKGKVFSCGHCGKVFYLSPCHVKRETKYGDKYCSRACSAKHTSQFNTARFNDKWMDVIRDRKRENNKNWKGSEATVASIHSWIKNNYTKKNLCDLCGTTEANAYDYSCKDHKYSRDIGTWWVLCRSCHMKYDYRMGFSKDTFGDTRGRRKVNNADKDTTQAAVNQ